MSEFRGRIYRSELATRRAEARAEWLATVELAADRLPSSILDWCVAERNLDAWWPGTSATRQEVA